MVDRIFGFGFGFGEIRILPNPSKIRTETESLITGRTKNSYFWLKVYLKLVLHAKYNVLLCEKFFTKIRIRVRIRWFSGFGFGFGPIPKSWIRSTTTTKVQNLEHWFWYARIMGGDTKLGENTPTKPKHFSPQFRCLAFKMSCIMIDAFRQIKYPAYIWYDGHNVVKHQNLHLFDTWIVELKEIRSDFNLWHIQMFSPKVHSTVVFY